MDNLLPIIISGGVLLLPLLTLCWTIAWTIISSIKQARDVKEHTQQLNQIQKEIALANRLHDRSAEILYRTRDVLIETYKSYVYLDTYLHFNSEMDKQIYFIKTAEIQASYSELSGLIVAVGDPQMIESLINTHFSDGLPKAEEETKAGEGAEERLNRIKAVIKLHDRINTLLKEGTQI